MHRGAGFPLTFILIAVAFLAFALMLQLPRRGDADLAYYHIRHLIPRFSRLVDTETALTPHLKKAIEEMVAERVGAHLLSSRGRPDFALRAVGARIAPELTTGCTKTFSWTCGTDDPNIAIDDDVRVGRCWHVQSLPAQLAIVLPAVISPSHVTVEHLPPVVPDISDAPRNMTLWGIVDGRSNRALYEDVLHTHPDLHGVEHPHIARNHLYAPLTSFTYDIHGEDPVQTFVISEAYAAAQMTFAVFVLELHNNWGGTSTCLYRVRIHGSAV